jgi:hypothetical protein
MVINGQGHYQGKFEELIAFVTDGSDNHSTTLVLIKTTFILEWNYVIGFHLAIIFFEKQNFECSCGLVCGIALHSTAKN